MLGQHVRVRASSHMGDTQGVSATLVACNDVALRLALQVLCATLPNHILLPTHPPTMPALCEDNVLVAAFLDSTCLSPLLLCAHISGLLPTAWLPLGQRLATAATRPVWRPRWLVRSTPVRKLFIANCWHWMALLVKPKQCSKSGHRSTTKPCRA